MLIWANANPNSNLNKHAPDFPDSYLYQLWRIQGNHEKTLFYRIDKSDLIVYTTEFCFYPTGYFEITSLASRGRQNISGRGPSKKSGMKDPEGEAEELGFGL